MRLETTLLVGGGHAAPPLIDIDWTVFIQLGIFLVLLFILTRLVFRPFLSMKEERGRLIDGTKEDALKLSKLTDEKLASYEEKILQTRKEAAAIHAALRQEGDTKASEILNSAKTKATADLEIARSKMEKTAQAAELALRTKADQIARSIASKLMGREV